MKGIVGILLMALPVFAQDGTVLVHGGDGTATYQAVLNELKKEGLSVESASLDAGIKTSTVVKGGWRQTGTHYEITFIPEGSKTTVRVAAVDQKRFKAAKTEPWSDPKIDPEKSANEAGVLKAGLGWE